MAEIGTDISKAAQLLREGKLVAIPTDTVYGLAGNAYDLNALAAIYAVKGRPSDKALVAQTDTIDKIIPFVKSFPEQAKKLANHYWPGALTLILEANEKISKEMIAGGTTIGVRICDHPLTLQLLATLDFPVALPSANLSGQPSATTAEEVNSQLGDQISYILDGDKSQLGFESTIIGFNGEKVVILRHGVISEEDIRKTLNS
ncbi:MAG: L-threonylcarbamoyladenylate synthase [Reichenbachiella sp.]